MFFRNALCNGSIVALAMVLLANDAMAQDDPVTVVTSPEDEPEEADDVNTMSSDDIFRRMFGREPPPIAQNKYTVVIDGINTGDATIDPNEDGWIEAEYLREKVLPLLLPDPADRLRGLLQRERVTFAELRALSYVIGFDRRDLVLTVEIPFELRDERIILLGPRPRGTVVDVIPQANISAFLNVRAGVDWVQSNPIEDTGLSGFVADFDAAVNIKGVVLEADFRYNEDSERRFTRGDIRATYDDVDSLIRYEAGDLSIGRRPYQNAPKIAGVAAYREFRIDPYTDPRPIGERGLVLDRAARVEVIVNGAKVRQVDLPPGRYSLRDFPIVPGALNDVEFVVTYGSGEVERFVFPAFTSIDLLGEGTSEFAINVGVPYEDEQGIREYDTSDFNLLGFYRRGLTSTLTAGASVEANKDLLLVGLETSWASPVGNIGINVSNDIRNPGLDSGRLSVQYNWQNQDPFRGTSVDALMVLTGDEYRTLDQLFAEAPDIVYASGRVSHAIDYQTRVQVGGNYRISSERDINGDRLKVWTLSANVSRAFGRLNVNAGLDYVDNSIIGTELIARVGIFVPLGRGTLTSSYTSRDNAFRADYTRSPVNAVGGFGYGAGVQFSDNGNQQSAEASYLGNRFEAYVEQIRSSYGGNTDIRTGALFGTSLVMADGDFAISRPVQNSFAIIRNGSSVDTRLAVEPRGSPLGGETKYAAYSDFLGPAVVPDLPAYFIRNLEVEAPDAPAGTGVGGEVFHVKPGFRAGYSLAVGTDGGTVSALGNLMFANGEPAGMLTGTVRRLDAEPGDPAEANDDEADAPFFTNAGGRFFIEGLDPGGEYEILLMVGGNPQRFVLTAPEDAYGIWNIEQPIVIEGGEDDDR